MGSGLLVLVHWWMKFTLILEGVFIPAQNAQQYPLQIKFELICLFPLGTSCVLERVPNTRRWPIFMEPLLLVKAWSFVM